MGDGSDEEEKDQFGEKDDNELIFDDKRENSNRMHLSQLESNDDISLSQISSVQIKSYDWKYTK